MSFPMNAPFPKGGHLEDKSMEREREPNGHGSIHEEDTLNLAEPLVFREPRRTGLWAMTRGAIGRVSERAAAANRWPSTATLAFMFTVFAWLAGLTAGAIWWGGGLNNEVANHKEEIRELRGIKAKYEAVLTKLDHEKEQRQKLDLTVEKWMTYEQSTREMLATGRFRLRDLPPLPKEND